LVPQAAAEAGPVGVGRGRIALSGVVDERPGPVLVCRRHEGLFAQRGDVRQPGTTPGRTKDTTRSEMPRTLATVRSTTASSWRADWVPSGLTTRPAMSETDTRRETGMSTRPCESSPRCVKTLM